MKPVFAIARLTFFEGIRMRVVVVLFVALAIIVLRLPFALRGDETLAGRLQTFLGYSFGAVTFLLSVATVFFSCASLSNEIKSRLIQLVVTKPIARWHVVLGKWLGVNALNTLLLLPTALVIYGFAWYVKEQPELFARDRLKVRDVVWTARESGRPVTPDFAAMARDIVGKAVAANELAPEDARQAEMTREVELRAEWRAVPRGNVRPFEFTGLRAPPNPNTAIQVRFKLRASPIPPNEEAVAEWFLLDPETMAPLDEPITTRKRIGDTHEFLFRAGPAIKDGRLVLALGNPWYDPYEITLRLDGDDALEVLYPVASFESNFAKALLLVFCKLLFLSAMGVCFSTFVSFPVGCFATLVAYLMCFGMPWWLESIGADLTAETRTDGSDPFGRFGPVIRPVLVPMLRMAFPNFAAYDGGTQLVDGMYIPLELIGRALAHLVLYGGVLLLVGWLVFARRELAEAQIH